MRGEIYPNSKFGSRPLKVLIAFLRRLCASIGESPKNKDQCRQFSPIDIVTGMSCVNQSHIGRKPPSDSGKDMHLFLTECALLPEEFLKNRATVILHDASQHRRLMIQTDI